MRRRCFNVYLQLISVFIFSPFIFGDIHHPPPDEETHNSFDIKPIVAEDVLSDKEIDKIATDKDYFYRTKLPNDEEPLWHKLDRKYSKKFFEKRTEIYDLPMVLKAVLQNGMPMRYQINQLYRAKLGPHIALGNVLPNLCLTLGDGMSPISLNNAFNGLLEFLFPQNWLALVAAGKEYNIAKYLFMQLALDQYYSTELQFIAVHKLIYDLEIYNFYLVHLELFTRILPPEEAPTLMVRGKMASVAGDMANVRIALRLALDQLAFMMALTHDQRNLLGASKINIANLEGYDETVKNLEEINKIYAHKDQFIQEVINRSIELRSVQELYKVSKLNVGITAFGQLLGVPSRGTPAQLTFTINYNYIPLILYSKSLSSTAEIDVDNQILKLINFARISWDTYKYNTGLYVEAQRSLIINRKAVKASLDNILDKGAKVDGVFLNSVIQVIDAHLKLNASAHSALGGLAQMRRLMVSEEANIINYIPIDKSINSALRLFNSTYGKISDDNLYLDNIMRIVHRKSKLVNILAGVWENKNKETRTFSEDSVKEAVSRNMSFLLYKHWNFPKKKGFYQILKKYVDDNEISLNPGDKDHLNNLTEHHSLRDLFRKE
jgi:hypothetical protein